MQIKYESIPHRSVETISCRDFHLSRFDCPYHMHPEIEILRIDKSEGRILVGDYTGSFKSGQIFIFGKNLPHAFINRDNTKMAWSRCIQMSEVPILGLVMNFPETHYLAEFLRATQRGFLLGSAHLDQASFLMDRVFESNGLTRIAATLQLLEYISRANELTPLASEGYAANVASRQVARLESVISHIHQNSSSNLNMVQLARIAAMSPTAFHRFFKQSLGQTPGSYLNDLRLSNAAHKLLETNDSIAEIAFSTGFNNLSNFNRLFKRRFGSSPREYRTRMEY